VASVYERTIPTERPQLVGEVSVKFADRWCHLVSVTDSYGRILGFLDRSKIIYVLNIFILRFCFLLRVCYQEEPSFAYYLSI
jgi:hypothetical protein